MKPIYRGDHEHCELRVAQEDRTCWTWAERDGGDEPDCLRLIGQGETYMLSTIFPGHDSGYADGGSRSTIKWVDNKITWERVPVAASPVASHFCLPCCDRWMNLREALRWIKSERDVA